MICGMRFIEYVDMFRLSSHPVFLTMCEFLFQGS